MGEMKPHQRVNDILLGPLERPTLQWLAAHMPVWMNPDILTGIGMLGAVVVFSGYALTNFHPAYLWLANLGFLINWFGDSLDGTLARYRHIERPKYGFFIDHTMDALSEVLIVTGLGLSAYVSFEIAMLALVGYLLMCVLVYIETYVDGLFKLSYGRFGPTEVRVILISVNIFFYVAGAPKIELVWGRIHVCDWIVGTVAAILIAVFVFSTIKRAIELGRLGE
jgi:phosphatidylglycerophosphate synthase